MKFIEKTNLFKGEKMELTSDKLTMLENKIVMMYILKKTRKPISYRVYLELVTSLAEVNFFDFHQLLQDLLNDGYISNFQEDRKIEKNLYNKDIDEAAKIIEEFKEKSTFRKLLKDETEIDEDEEYIQEEPLDLRNHVDENKIINKENEKQEKNKEKNEEIFDEIEEEKLEGEQTFQDLLQNKKEEEKEKITLYFLTEKGKQALNLSIDTLPGITKLRIDSDFNKYYKIIREAYSVLTSYIPKKDLVICKIVENYQEIFKMEIVVGSVEQAKNISKNWKSRADEIYLDILKKLSEED